MYYTGIGSRRTPAPILATMTTIARYLAERGWTLRSGGATGADSAFERGALSVGYAAHVFLPWKGFGGRRNGWVVEPASDSWAKAYTIAAWIHPNWWACDDLVQRLHTRNIFQVSGPNLDNLSSFVVYWAPEVNGEPQGGTRTAVMYARELGVPTFNLLHGTDSSFFRGSRTPMLRPTKLHQRPAEAARRT